jgi:heptaprenyl diphosphate synthase
MSPSTYPGAVPGATQVDEDLSTALGDGLDVVEAELQRAVAHEEDLVDAVTRHLLLAGGKRVRPMLTMLCSHLGDASRPEVVTAAVAVELTHLASLYHDDVMDSAPVRRGAPAAHQVWGNEVAILTGDLLFARASRLVADLGPSAVRLHSETFERLCLGQLHETMGPRPGADPVAHHVQVLADKTGSLIATSARYGAELSGCSPEVVRMVVAYGEAVGVAFQLADDVLDLADPDERAARTGKVPGTDLREGVPTLPVLLARRAAEEGDPAAAVLVQQLDADLADDVDLAAAVLSLRGSPYPDAALAAAHQWADRAVAAIAPLPGGAVKDALVSFANQVVDRDH